MKIEFRCPHCSHRLSVHEERAGKEMHCVYCGDLIHVPVASPHPTHDELLVKAGVVREGGLSRAERGPVLARLLGICALAGLVVIGYYAVAWFMQPVEPKNLVGYDDPKATFSVTIPEGCPVAQEDLRLPTSKGKSLDCSYYRTHCGLYEFTIKVLNAKFEDWSNQRSAAEVAIDAIAAELQGTGVSITKVEDLERGPYHPRRCYATGSGDQRERGAIGEAYIFNERSYILIVEGETEKLNASPTVKTFFDSFKITTP